MGNETKPKMKAFYADIHWWSEEDNPYNVNDSSYTLAARNKTHAKELLEKEALSHKNRKVAKYNISLEEIPAEEHLRHHCWTNLQDSIISSQAVQDEISDYAKELLEINHTNRYSCNLSELLKDPKNMYHFIRDKVTPDSIIFIHNGKMNIFNPEKSKPTFFKRELDIIENKMLSSVNKQLEYLDGDLEKCMKNRKIHIDRDIQQVTWEQNHNYNYSVGETCR